MGSNLWLLLDISSNGIFIQTVVIEDGKDVDKELFPLFLKEADVWFYCLIDVCFGRVIKDFL